MPEATFRLEPAQDADFERLFALRMRSMRESLERLGRFDMERGRARFAASFRPAYSWLILDAASSLIGCVAFGPRNNALWLEHFYIEPDATGFGIGTQVLVNFLKQADEADQSVHLDVLRESAAVRFYARHGFVETHRDELDIFMQRARSPR